MPKLTFKLIVLLFITGLLAGIVGMSLIWLLEIIQKLTYGFAYKNEISFRFMVEHTTPAHRLLALICCGVIAGFGWCFLHRSGAKLINLKQSIQNPDTPIPLFTTLINGLLQIITVGMGSPLGRETAPREISTALTHSLLPDKLALSLPERQLLLGCAAAAGLAAVYEVPLAGTVFALETLFLSWHYSAVIGSLICCSTAALLMHLLSPYNPSYQLPTMSINHYLWLWALLTGPILAVAAFYLNKILEKVKPKEPRRLRTIFQALIAFTIIGILAMCLPEILGNGRAGNELIFTDTLNWTYAVALLVAKCLALLLATFGGAYGGRITPALMIGALLAFLLAFAWNCTLPEISLIGASVIGAAVFLGLLQNMPFTAVILVLELTHFTPVLLLPIGLCLATALIIKIITKGKI